MLYDMTHITDPTLVQMFHLSPGTKDRSPGLAYNDATIGYVDPEIALFLDDKDSPSGNAGFVIMGAHTSLYLGLETGICEFKKHSFNVS